MKCMQSIRRQSTNCIEIHNAHMNNSHRTLMRLQTAHNHGEVRSEARTELGRHPLQHQANIESLAQTFVT